MFKKYWLIILVIVLVLAATVLTVASLVHRPTITPTISHIDCNGQQATAGPGGTAASNRCQGRLLVFTKTGGFRHASIVVPLLPIDARGGCSCLPRRADSAMPRFRMPN